MKKAKKFVISIFFALTAVLFGACFGDNGQYSSLEIALQNLPNKEMGLMVVAHPDDETIWGAKYLLKYDFFVLVVSNGGWPHNRAEEVAALRYIEMTNAMAVSNTPFYILDYTDDLRGFPENEIEDIISDIRFVIESRNWNRIVTFNECGATGHRQHIQMHEIVTELVKYTKNAERLYYFVHHSRVAVARGDVPPTVTCPTMLSQINRMLDYYLPTQRQWITQNRHMAAVQQLVPAVT
ncbi:MAG: PIG-L family deacetylase [Firmicutes bacterium]|nr:PIG-L family deacetylase [Bacillota bacterium]